MSWSSGSSNDDVSQSEATRWFKRCIEGSCKIARLTSENCELKREVTQLKAVIAQEKSARKEEKAQHARQIKELKKIISDDADESEAKHWFRKWMRGNCKISSLLWKNCLLREENMQLRTAQAQEKVQHTEQLKGLKKQIAVLERMLLQRGNLRIPPPHPAPNSTWMCGNRFCRYRNAEENEHSDV